MQERNESIHSNNRIILLKRNKFDGGRNHARLHSFVLISESVHSKHQTDSLKTKKLNQSTPGGRNFKTKRKVMMTHMTHLNARN